MITKNQIQNGFISGIVRIIDSPNGDGAVCQIVGGPGENWFYFGGQTAENCSAAQYLKSVPMDTIINEVMDALESFRTCSGGPEYQEEYQLYAKILQDTEPKPTEIRLPFGEMTLIVRGDKNGYEGILEKGAKTQKAFEVRVKEKKICGEEFEVYEGTLVTDASGGYGMTLELVSPDNTSDVIRLPDGRLYCQNCKCFVPNTANAEMRKEGCYAHSHMCGIRGEGEVC